MPLYSLERYKEHIESINSPVEATHKMESSTQPGPIVRKRQGERNGLTEIQDGALLH